jgi:hypothetical protein
MPGEHVKARASVAEASELLVSSSPALPHRYPMQWAIVAAQGIVGFIHVDYLQTIPDY